MRAGWRWPFERFRCRRATAPLLGIGLAASAVASAGALVWDPAELGMLEAGEWPAAWARGVGLAAPAVASMMGLVWFLLRWLRPARLAELTVALLGTGFSLVVGGLGRWSWSLAPVVLAISVAIVVLLLRRRRHATGPSITLRLLAVLIASLLLGGGVSAGLTGGFPDPALATSGTWLVGAVVAALLLGLLPLASAGLLDLRTSVVRFIDVRYL